MSLLAYPACRSRHVLCGMRPVDPPPESIASWAAVHAHLCRPWPRARQPFRSRPLHKKAMRLSVIPTPPGFFWNLSTDRPGDPRKHKQMPRNEGPRPAPASVVPPGVVNRAAFVRHARPSSQKPACCFAHGIIAPRQPLQQDKER